MTKLIASLIVADSELDRYLKPCLEHLREFCDEIRVVVDVTEWDARTPSYLLNETSVEVTLRPKDQSFYDHEGRARQHLLNWTLEGEPTHILNIDADEFVTDPVAVREAVENDAVDVWTLAIKEVWEVCDDVLCTRVDGLWGTSPVPCLWRVPNGEPLRIRDAALACGRVPHLIEQRRTPPSTGSDILHLGWANRGDREARYQRYVEHDGGRFHNRAHLDSIMYSDAQVRLAAVGWPPALEFWRERILDRANR